MGWVEYQPHFVLIAIFEAADQSQDEVVAAFLGALIFSVGYLDRTLWRASS
ncbi:hypothetical protein RFN31_29160 [Mesorhizobium sp. VK3C]|nr:hypothetical protein [Mesorhizobium sp. VK3C]